MSEAIQAAVSAPPFSLIDMPIYRTVRLETVYANGKSGEATGFLFSFPVTEGRIIPFVVSNKHVYDFGPILLERFGVKTGVEA